MLRRDPMKDALTLLRFRPSTEARLAAYRRGELAAYRAMEEARAQLLEQLWPALGMLAAIAMVAWVIAA